MDGGGQEPGVSREWDGLGGVGKLNLLRGFKSGGLLIVLKGCGVGLRVVVEGCGVGLVAAGSATFGRGLASHATILVHCGLWRQPLPGTNVNRKKGETAVQGLDEGRAGVSVCEGWL